MDATEIINIWDLDVEDGEEKEEEEEEEYDGKPMSSTIMAGKKIEAKQTALEKIYELQLKIEKLEQRLQTLLTKYENGDYFGTIPELDPVIKSYMISFDGSATSIDDESIVETASAEIFIETMVTKADTSKFRVTGGEILIGDTFYDLAFGKARISSSGPSGEKVTMVLLGQVIDFGDENDDGSTLKLVLNSEMPLEGDFGLVPITIDITPKSKIAKQWVLSASGQLSLLQV